MITTSLSLAHHRKTNKQQQQQKKKLSTNLTLYVAHTNHWTKLRRAETKRKKELNLEGKGDLKYNKLKNNNNEKA